MSDGARHERLIDMLEPEDMFWGEHVRLVGYAKQIRKRGETVDFPSLYTETGDDEAVLDLLRDAATTRVFIADPDGTVEKIKQMARTRELMQDVFEFVRDVPEEPLASLEKITERAKTKLPRRRAKDSKWFLDAVKTPLYESRIETGFPKLDNVLGWLPKKSVSITAARPSVGKTAHSLNVAVKQKRKGKNVLMISLEMSEEQIMERVASMMSGVNYERINHHVQSDEEQAKMDEGMALFDSYEGRFVVVDDVFSIDKIVSEIARERPDLVIVDFVQFVACNEGNNTNERIGNIMKAFKRAAKAYECHINILSQLNREADKDDEPTMRHLRDSGELEQYADIIMFLHRPGVLKATYQKDDCSVIVAKNKFGRTGKISNKFFGDTQRFKEL
jgi:replicative DNA helicase